ncbi:MAG: pseudouridine synthase [Patescibacteria group bacterium]|nr:pseudouridine synthase [Patescibacteria group bacterium]MDD5715502.1 pseudouridine synthase [Patescibacteria group bacterium]
MRLNKFISSCGVASRRKADALITRGLVMVNGAVVHELGISVDPQTDEVVVDGTRCIPRELHTYLALNKPAGYVCTHAHYAGEKSIFDLLPPQYRSLKIAGRLDKESEGLIILSDDGNFVYRLTHPKFKHEKEYEVTLNTTLSPGLLQRLKTGVCLKEGEASVDRINFIQGTAYRLTLHQGWKRQIRRMFEVVGRATDRLVRIREGRLLLGTLPPGRYRSINRTDVE